jgi:hypothetical protein
MLQIGQLTLRGQFRAKQRGQLGRNIQYRVHIFGTEHTFFSLVFQEQDQVLSACATTAVWITLNGIGLSSDLKRKSPGQITIDAGTISQDGSRIFPNHGLSIRQICLALNASGLVNEVKTPDISWMRSRERMYGISHSYLRKIINAYSPIKAPIILGVNVPGKFGYGLHAITVNGFSQKKYIAPKPQKEISFSCDQITKLYTHDDQFGPFVRLEFSKKTKFGYITPWTSNNKRHFETFITTIIIPLYPKIRIGYEDIEDIVISLDSALSYFLKKSRIDTDIVWDIKVHYSIDYKENIKHGHFGNDTKLNVLKKHYPKYVWIASCNINGYPVFDFLFDATDIAQGMVAFDVISYFSDIPQYLSDSISQYESRYRDAFKKLPSGIQYYDYYKKKFLELAGKVI